MLPKFLWVATAEAQWPYSSFFGDQEPPWQSLQPQDAPPVCPRRKGAPPSSTSTSSGAAAPLALVLENTLHSVLPPAELLCRLSKKGGQGSVRGAEWAGQHHALHAGARPGQVMQLRQPTRAGLGSYQTPNLAGSTGGLRHTAKDP